MASLITSKKYQTLCKMVCAFVAVLKHKNRQKNFASGKLWEHVHWRNQDVFGSVVSKMANGFWLLLKVRTTFEYNAAGYEINTIFFS